METNSEIFNKIQDRIKNAMVSKDNIARDLLRTVVSDIKNQTVNANPQKEITDSVCLKVLERSAKNHRDSISQFSSAGRTDLEEKEASELKIIEEFLPRQLTEDETRAIVMKFLDDSGIEPIKKNMGLVMKSIPSTPGLDRKLVASILGKVLS